MNYGIVVLCFEGRYDWRVVLPVWVVRGLGSVWGCKRSKEGCKRSKDGCKEGCKRSKDGCKEG